MSRRSLCRRTLASLSSIITLLVLVLISGPQGALPIGIASAHDLAIAQAAINRPPSTGAGRFVPSISAPTLKTTTWHPPAVVKPPAPVGTTAMPRTVNALAAGRKPGEQADLRTQNSSTILNVDGTWTVQTYTQPVHYQDAQGNWQNIDTSVVSDTSDSGFAYGNKANSWHIHFASSTDAPHLVHAAFPAADVTETLQGAASVSGVASGSQMLYAGIFPGVDLQYTLMKAHVEEMLLLHDANGPASYTFTYHVPGATAHQDARGDVLFTDAKGNLVFVIGGVSMYEADAHGQRNPTGRGTDNVHVTLSGSGPDYTVTLTPDHNWLTAAGRAFPVAIDPTWSSTDPHTNTSSGSIYGDTFDESANPTWAFYTDQAERIGNFNINPPGYNTGTNRAYIKFPIGGPPANNLRITSASLTLWQTSSYAGNVQIIANAITSSWNETALTWNTHPTGFVYGGTGNASTSYNVSIGLDVSNAAYAWWGGRLGVNGFELQYANESQAGNFFASDDYGSHLPSLTINYTQDTTVPGGSLTINGSAAYTNSQAVTLTPSYSDTGANNEWNSNWSTVNGVTKITTGNGADANQPAAWSVDSAGSQLISDTSKCGTTACWVQTYFSHTIGNMANYPTFTAMFKTDYLNNFEFGAENSGNAGTRFMLHANSTGFVTAMVSKSAGSWSSYGMSYGLSPNTWYYGQVDFPLSNVGEIYIWPVGQTRPITPTYYATGITMANPGLIFQHNGDNAANLHHFNVANVVMTSKGSGSTGYGVWGMDFANDGATWSCPTPGSGTWCVAAGRQTGWALSSGDGTKTVSVRYVDNAGNVSLVGSNHINLDTTPPNASVTAPANGREVRGVVTVTANASDPAAPDGSAGSGLASVALLVDGQQQGSAVSGTTTPSFQWDTTNLPSGEHTLSVQATDTLGNARTSACITVDISNTGQMPYETFAMRDLPAGGISAGANVATGNAIVTEQDLDIPSRGPDLAIGRTYNDLAPVNTLFGWGWTSDLDEGLSANADGSITYRDPSGGFHVFLPNGSGGFVAPLGLYLTLVKNADGTYTLTSRDQSKTTFNAGGYITSITDRNGNALSIAYNTSNLPTTVTDAAGRQLTLTVTNGHISAIAAPGSRTYGYAYDGSGNLTDYTDPAGIDTHYVYDSAHRLTSITLNYVSGGATDQQTNVTTTLTYDTNNRLVTIVDPLGYDAGIAYNTPGTGQTTVSQLQTNPNTTPATSGSVYEQTVYTAATDGSGAVAQIQEPLGGSTQVQYDSNGNVTQVIDPNGHVSTSTYDTNGNRLTHTLDPNGLKLTTTWTYDGSNDVLSENDPHGVVTQYTYDAPGTGNLTKEVQDVGHSNVTTTFTYDQYGEALTKTDPMGVTTAYTYDNQGDTLSATENYQQNGPTNDHTNVTTSATYDALGEKLTSTDALGIVTRTTYDIRGNVIQTVANCVDVSSGTYKCDAGIDNTNDQNLTNGYRYDPLGRQISLTNPRGVVTVTVYDLNGRNIQQIQNCVDLTPGTYTCDAGGDSINDQNILTKTGYDAAGNATLSTDPKGNTTTTTYDLDNRATEKVIKNAAGAQVSDTKTTYDAYGNTLSIQTVDGKNNPTTTYTYDAANRKATEGDPPAAPGASDQSGQSNITTYTYDTAGNVTETIVTNSAVTPGPVSDTTATFDNLGHQLTKTEEANGSSTSGPTGSGPQTTSYAYDADGRQTSTTDPSNNTTTTSYDALGRATSVQHPDGTLDATTYDADGRTLSQGNCGGTKAGTGTTADTYDALSRVTTEQKNDCAGALQTSVAYTYDANGNKLTQSTSAGSGPSTVTQWTYDKLDRIATLNDGSRSYTYDVNGNVTNTQALSSSGGVATAATYTYDGGNRLTSQTDTVGPSNTQLHAYTYTYDGNGNRNSVTEDSTTTSYTYDGADQLLSVASGGTTTATYTYDANHNRTSMVTSAGTTAYTYDTNTDTLLTQKADPNGKITTYAYDTNGNLTTAVYDPTGVNQTTTYKYDASNRLTEIDQPDGTTITFTYDADGNRVSKSVTAAGSTPTTTGVKDVYQLGHLAYQTDLSGNLLATFTYDSNEVPTSVVVGSDPNNSPRYYYVYNGHGDVVALVDGSGNVVAHYAYDEFGNLTDNTEQIPNTNGWVNPYRYDGRDEVRYDSEMGLYWMSVRAYDPALGRFLSRDPLGRLPLMWAEQPYVYAGNNPLINVDPSGQRFAALDGGGGKPTPTPAPKGSSGAKTTSGNSPKKSKACEPAWWCGIRDKGEFFLGVGIVAAGLVTFGVAIVALIKTTTDPFWKFAFEVVKRGFRQAAGALAQMISQALQHILDSLVYVNPWIRVIVDAFAVLADVAALVISFLSGFDAVQARGQETWTAFQKFLFVFRAIGKGQLQGVFGAVADALGASFFGILTGVAALAWDIRTLWIDINTARNSH